MCYRKREFFLVSCACSSCQARGKSDLWNGALGGCFAGAALAVNGGLIGMGMGCAGMGAFGVGMEGTHAYLHS